MIGKNIGRYHILEQLGQGGMATVYKAYDTQLERDVALKMIRMDMFPAAAMERVLKRFEREAKALARLSHPNIVGVMDYGEYDGAPFLVMKYVPGGTMKELIGSPIPYQQAARILKQVAKALAYAHSQGILHRDVKPSNILLSENGEVTLTDFGIAKILDTNKQGTLTETGLGIGTPEYMAPEQGLGKNIDGRADIYALGVVFYELITGHKPYTADTPMAVIIKQINDPLPNPREFVSALSDQVEKVLFKALARNPEDRYQSMDEFSKALQNLSESSFSSQVIIESGFQPLSVNKELSQVDEEKTRDSFEPPREMIPHWDEQMKRSWLKRSIIGVVIITVLLGIFALNQNRKEKIAIAEKTQEAQNTEAALIELIHATEIAQTESVQNSIVDKTATASAWTSTPEITATSVFSLGATRLREIDDMIQVYVPAGEFQMGTYNGQDDEKPVHSVNLTAYWIDQTEITNNQYSLCVEFGKCSEPGETKSNTRGSYYGNDSYSNYPIINVNKQQAMEYCEWIGGRLPTEAEWEKAARGIDERKYPWGNDDPTTQLAQYEKSEHDTVQVNKFAEVISPYGVYNLSGNVSEWVSDWYAWDYYQYSPIDNPTGSDNKEFSILRGGSWVSSVFRITTTNRQRVNANTAYNYAGFRCVSIE